MKLFNWFNPLWLVQNLFTTSLNPITIGAGIGALGSAVQGKSPFTGALLGGGLGGLGSAGGLFGSGSGLLSGLKGVATTPVSLGTGGYASGIGGQIIPEIVANTVAPAVAQTATQNFIPQHLIGNSTGMANYIPGGPFMPGDALNFVENTPYMPGASQAIASAPNFTPVLGKSVGATGGGYNPSFFGRIDDTLGNPFSSLTASDKLGLGLKGFDAFNQPQEPIRPAQMSPITPGNPNQTAPNFNINPSSNLRNVNPNVGMQEGNEIGLPNLETTMPLSDEEILRLQQMLQTTGYRGR
jgi:hypothetical protein